MQITIDSDNVKIENGMVTIDLNPDQVADNAIITAMSTIYLNRGDMNSAKIWLDKLTMVQ